jgi:hypothetical protein
MFNADLAVIFQAALGFGRAALDKVNGKEANR